MQRDHHAKSYKIHRNGVVISVLTLLLGCSLQRAAIRGKDREERARMSCSLVNGEWTAFYQTYLQVPAISESEAFKEL